MRNDQNAYKPFSPSSDWQVFDAPFPDSSFEVSNSVDLFDDQSPFGGSGFSQKKQSGSGQAAGTSPAQPGNRYADNPFRRRNPFSANGNPDFQPAYPKPAGGQSFIQPQATVPPQGMPMYAPGSLQYPMGSRVPLPVDPISQPAGSPYPYLDSTAAYENQPFQSSVPVTQQPCEMNSGGTLPDGYGQKEGFPDIPSNNTSNLKSEQRPVSKKREKQKEKNTQSVKRSKKLGIFDVIMLILTLVMAAALTGLCMKIDKELQDHKNSAAVITEMKEKGAALLATQDTSQTVQDYSAYESKKSQYAHLIEEADSSTRTKQSIYSDNPLNNILESVAAAQEIYTDTVGFLTIPGLLNETVYQNQSSPLYYYDHNGENNLSSEGAVYADASIDFDRPVENILLYGRSGTQGKCFAPLLGFSQYGNSFAAEYITANLVTLYEEKDYVLFSVIELTDENPTETFLSLMSSSFSTDAEMMRYVVEAKALSLYDIVLDVAPQDRLLTLYAFSESGSPVVLVYRTLRDEEFQ